jgi:hypothetical protein
MLKQVNRSEVEIGRSAMQRYTVRMGLPKGQVIHRWERCRPLSSLHSPLLRPEDTLFS